MYAMISTRPDIAFAVGQLSKYTSNPSALHWQALGRVFQYLKGTMDYGLTYSGYPSVLKDKLTLVELCSHLYIEDSLRVQDINKPKGNNVAGPSVINMVEHNNSTRYNDNKGKRKHQDTKADPNKKSKMTCWKCRKPGHLKKNYKGRKVTNKANGLVNGSSNSLKGQNMFNKSLQIYYVTYVSESYLVQDDDVTKNLVSSSILNNCGYEQVVEFDKFVLSKHVIGFGYLSNQMFMLNIVNDDISSAFMSSSKLNYSILWHARLGYVHFKRMQDMSKDRFSSVPRPSQRSLIETEYIDGSVVPKEVTEEVVVQQHEPELRKSKRNRTPKNEVSDQHSYCINVEDDLKIFDEAMKSQDVAFRKEAINYEMDSIIGNSTWVLADLPLVSTLMDTSEKLMPNNGQAVSQLEYSRVIGCLILTYSGYPLVLKGYTNVSWISNTEDNSSTSGWVFLLGGGKFSLASKKQTCITSSTMEYEFVALATTGKEAEWLKNMIIEIPLWSKPITPISIRCNSAAKLANAYSQMYNKNSRHLGVRHNMIRELIMNEVLSIEFVSGLKYMFYNHPKDVLEPAKKEDEIPSGSVPSEDLSSTGKLISESFSLNTSAVQLVCSS
nr:zinc finger, CCHC-type [Tanacetum cinerariifolium]